MREIYVSVMAAIVMGILEAFILTQEYKRSSSLYVISIIVAILMAFFGSWGSIVLSKYIKGYNPPFIMFILMMLIELPLSLYGYELQPEAKLIERLAIAPSFGAVVYIIGNQLVHYLNIV